MNLSFKRTANGKVGRLTFKCGGGGDLLPRSSRLQLLLQSQPTT